MSAVARPRLRPNMRRTIVTLLVACLLAACGTIQTSTASRNKTRVRISTRTLQVVARNTAELSGARSGLQSVLGPSDLTPSGDTLFEIGATASGNAMLYRIDLSGDIRTGEPTPIGGVPANIVALDFIDATNGWLATDSAGSDAIYATSDDGRDWKRQASLPALSLYFMNATTGFAVVGGPLSNPTIETTTNGGVSWTEEPSAIVHQFGSLFTASMTSANGTLYLLLGGQPSAGSQRKALLSSTDDGRTWKSVGRISSSGYVGPLVIFHGGVISANSSNGLTLLRSSPAARLAVTRFSATLGDIPVGAFVNHDQTLVAAIGPNHIVWSYTSSWAPLPATATIQGLATVGDNVDALISHGRTATVLDLTSGSRLELHVSLPLLASSLLVGEYHGDPLVMAPGNGQPLTPELADGSGELRALPTFNRQPLCNVTASPSGSTVLALQCAANRSQSILRLQQDHWTSISVPFRLDAAVPASATTWWAIVTNPDTAGAQAQTDATATQKKGVPTSFIAVTTDQGHRWTLTRLDNLTDLSIVGADASGLNAMLLGYEEHTTSPTSAPSEVLVSLTRAGRDGSLITLPAGVAPSIMDFVSHDKGYFVNSEATSVYETSTDGRSWHLVTLPRSH